MGRPVENNYSYKSSPMPVAKQLLALKLHETVTNEYLSSKLRQGTGATTTQQPKPPSHGPTPQWVIDIGGNLARAGAEEARGAWGRCSVHRVPRWLRDRDQRAYTPQVVSIGPLHHGSRRLREMEAHKWRALHRALRRTGRQAAELAAAVRAAEGEARDCYEGRAAWMPSDDLVRCLVLDGTFVLEMFRGVAGGGKGFVEDLGHTRNDPVFAMRSVLHAVRSDMILLENQIPFLVLERLLRLLPVRGNQLDLKGGCVARLAERFFDPLKPTAMLHRRYGRSDDDDQGSAAAFDPLSRRQMLHCLDVFRRSLLRPSPPPLGPQPPCVADKRRQQFMRCVTELREAGIRFQPRHDAACFWDIRFADGVLHIPRILIHDGTKSVLLNLVAFEQCHMGSGGGMASTARGNNITMYAIFMDNLINSAEDVRHLHRRGIIEHWLGSDADVARLFNRLCEEVVFDVHDSYLSKLSEQVNKYYNYKWSTWIASLKHNYFKNPWTIISLIAAVFLLLLTVTQTFYTTYGYYHPLH